MKWVLRVWRVAAIVALLFAVNSGQNGTVDQFHVASVKSLLYQLNQRCLSLENTTSQLREELNRLKGQDRNRQTKLNLRYVVDLYREHPDYSEWKTKKYTLLHFASERGLSSAVEKLIIHGADVNAYSSLAGYALHTASKNGHAEAVEILLQHGANLMSIHQGDHALRWAVERGDAVDVVNAFLQHGMNATAPLRSNGVTLLHLAAVNGRLEAVKLLLQHGVDVNVRLRDGSTALHVASSNGRVKVAKLLIGRGADVNATRTDNNWTPLHEATAQGHSEVVKVLLQHGADVNAKSNVGETALHQASYFGNTSPVTWNPSMLTRLVGRLDMVRTLVEGKADVSAKDNIGRTPLAFATNDAIKNLLRQHGAT